MEVQLSCSSAILQVTILARGSAGSCCVRFLHFELIIPIGSLKNCVRSWTESSSSNQESSMQYQHREIRQKSRRRFVAAFSDETPQCEPSLNRFKVRDTRRSFPFSTPSLPIRVCARSIWYWSTIHSHFIRYFSILSCWNCLVSDFCQIKIEASGTFLVDLSMSLRS